MGRVKVAANSLNRLRPRRGRRSQCEWREVDTGTTGRVARALLFPFALASLLVACAPTREAMTAGEIGCRPNELSVHDETSSVGWAQSADTWVAECRGRRFICTEVMTSSVDFGWLFNDSVDSRDSDVSCHEEISSTPPKVEAREAPLAPHSEPPHGGAGFELGSARETARERCESHGHAYRDEGTHTFCSGTAAPLGFEASTQLTFCKDALCGITISQVPKSAWAAAFKDLDSRLTEKYGPATVRRVRVPSICRTMEQFDRCALDGALDFEVRWQWPRGERLRLMLDKSASSGEASLRLMYVTPPGVRRGKSSAL
jgi:hypothetical protein